MYVHMTVISSSDYKEHDMFLIDDLVSCHNMSMFNGEENFQYAVLCGA